MVSKALKFVSHLEWISVVHYDVAKEEFYTLMMFIKSKCLCDKDIKWNFTFVNIEVVLLLARVKGFSLVNVH